MRGIPGFRLWPLYLTGVALCAAAATAWAGALPPDPNPPTIYVTPPGNVQCRNPTVQVFLNPTATDPNDPNPSIAISNRTAGDPNGTPNNTDPDFYPYGSRQITITSCDHPTTTQVGCTTKTVPLTVWDTLPPNLNAGKNVVYECTSPLGTAGAPVYCETLADNACKSTAACTAPNTVSSSGCVTCKSNYTANCVLDGNVHLPRPVVSDLCDPNAMYQETLPSFFPIGLTTVPVIAYDKYGNTSNANISATVRDTTPPAIVGGTAPIAVLFNSAAACTGSGFSGTAILMPTPKAIDTCTTTANLTYTWSGTLAGHGSLPPTTNPLICFPGPSGNTTAVSNIQVNVGDAAGNVASTSQFTVSVGNSASFPLSIVIQPGTSNGWVTNGVVNANAIHAVGAVSWNLVGAGQPTNVTASSTIIAATFSGSIAEGSYCPTYVNAQDSSSQVGGSSGVCFGVDVTAPSYTFTSVPTTATQPNQTLPAFSHGQKLPLQVNIGDSNGFLPSGLLSATVTLTTPSSATSVVYNANYCTLGSNVSTLPVCPATHFIAGCNVPGAIGCPCTAKDPVTQECTTDGRLDFSSLPPGMYSLNISVTDAAGNQISGPAYPFTVTDLQGAFANSPSSVVAMMLSDINNPNVDASVVPQLTLARNQLITASGVALESPGMAFILAQQAFNNVGVAITNSTHFPNGPYYQTQIAQFVNGEVRGIVNATQNANLTDWAMIAPDPNYPVNKVNGLYQNRSFLIDRGFANTPPAAIRDYKISVANTLGLAQAALAQSNNNATAGNLANSIASSLTAFNAITTLYQDRTFQTIYAYRNYVAHTINSNNVTWPQAYFKGGPPQHFGAEIGLTVADQISRFATLIQNPCVVVPGVVPLSAVNVTLDAMSKANAFAQAAVLIQNPNWYQTGTGQQFGNQGVTQSVYLNAVSALQDLRNLAGSVVYTQLWQAGLSMTLANVINFSMYEGPSALTCILWGADVDGAGHNWGNCGNSNIAFPGHPFIYDYNGKLPANATLDPAAQIAECRYVNMMYALTGGRLSNPNNNSGAVDLFVNSECLIVQMYNKYYTTGRYFPNDKVINPNYPLLNPNTYVGCGAPTVYNQNNVISECGACALGLAIPTCPTIPQSSNSCDATCDGVDDDCNGFVDDGVVITNCGCGNLPPPYLCPCGANSACINGQALPCVPGVPPTTVNNTCSLTSLDCSSTPNDNWVPASCGIGACASAQQCQNGNLIACVPLTGSLEICDGIDNNCNVLVDEGLDNDHDGWACQPGSGSACKECSPLTNGCCNSLTTNCTGNANYFSPCQGEANLLNSQATTNANNQYWDCDDTDPTSFPGNPEVCDGRDNNCNGLVDEGVLNACNSCDQSCVATSFGGTGAPFVPTSNNSSNVNTVANSNNPNVPNGALQLGSASTFNNRAWIANDTAGTVSKIDTTTGREIGRFCTALQTGYVNPATPNVPDPRAEPTVCGACNGCNRGSRTSITLQGDMIIGNRSFGYQGNYTKIANLVTSCVDVNGDGVIQTSTDVNGDGVITTSNPNEYFGEKDECILWTRRPVHWDVPTAQQPTCSTMNTTTTSNPNYCTTDYRCKIFAVCQGSGNTTCASYDGLSSATCTGQAGCAYTASCIQGANPLAKNCGNYTTQTSCQMAQCTWGLCSTIACSTATDSGTCASYNPSGQSYCAWTNTCIDLGSGNFWPRAVANDANNHVWIGAFEGAPYMPSPGVWQVNNQDGYPITWVPTTNLPYNPNNGAVKSYSTIQPYGASIDHYGILWMPNNCCGTPTLASVNTGTNYVYFPTNPNGLAVVTGNPNTALAAVSKWWWGPLGAPSAYASYTHSHTGTNRNGGSYGIAVDGKFGVWLGGYNGGGQYTGSRYDATRDTWIWANPTANANGTVNTSAGDGRGVTVDASGHAWIAQHGGGYGARLTAYDGYGALAAGLTVAPVWVRNGVTMDFYLGPGSGTNNACPGCVGYQGTYPFGYIPIGVGIDGTGRIWMNVQSTSNIAVVDPNNPSVFGFYPVGGPAYTYSDFTGSILATFTAPAGAYAEIVSACNGVTPTQWISLTWNGFEAVGGTGDPRTASAIQVHVRLASSLSTNNPSTGASWDPISHTSWSYWYPGDQTNPSNGTNPLYWTIVPTANLATASSSPCVTQGVAIQQPNPYNPNTPTGGGFPLTGCVDLKSAPTGSVIDAFALPTTFTLPGQTTALPANYIEVEIRLVADSTSTYIPSLSGFQLARTCPQF